MEKSAWVTGTTSGLGRELASDLARRGWRLLLPVRGPERIAELLTQVARMGAPEPVVWDCDLADHGHVAAVCAAATDVGPIDLVINNAAVGGGADAAIRETNAAGVEMRMAVNAVTPHLVATLLAPALAPGGRIVQVGSVGQAALPLDDLNFERGYDGVEAYCRSKLALVMSAMQLGARGVPINVVHPAHAMPTRMVHEGGIPVQATLDDGVLSVLRMALDSGLADVRGAYFDRFDRARPHAQALDPAARTAIVGWIERQLG